MQTLIALNHRFLPNTSLDNNILGHAKVDGSVNSSKSSMLIKYGMSKRGAYSLRFNVFAEGKTGLGFEDGIIRDSFKDLHMVKVKFSLQKKCKFGQHFRVIGSTPEFGLWNPKAAVALEWTEGDIWMKEIEVPAGQRIEYKFLLIDKKGEITWQPGRNGVFETVVDDSSVTISSKWEAEDKTVEVVHEKEEKFTKLTGLNVGALDASIADYNADLFSQGSNGALSSSVNQTEIKDYEEALPDIFGKYSKDEENGLQQSNDF